MSYPPQQYDDISGFPDQDTFDDTSGFPDQESFEQPEQHNDSFLGNLFSTPNAVRMGGSMAADYAGAALSPFTGGLSYPALSFLGGAASEGVARYMEGQPFNPYIMGIEGAANLLPGPNIPGAGAGLKEIGEYAAKSAGYGAVQGAVGATPRHMAETGNIWSPEGGVNLPTMGEVAGQTAGGAVVGGAVGGGLGAAHVKYQNSRPVPPTPPWVDTTLGGQPIDTPGYVEGPEIGPYGTGEGQAGLPFGSYRGQNGRWTTTGPGYQAPPSLESVPPQSTPPPPPTGPEPTQPPLFEPPPAPPAVAPTNNIDITGPNVIPEGTSLSDNQQVVTIHAPNAASVEYWRNQGYVTVPGLRSASGQIQMVRGDVAPLYITGDMRATPAPTPAPAPVQGRPEIPGAVASDQAVAGDTVPVPSEKVTPSFIENMRANGYQLVQPGPVTSLFKRFVQDPEGGVSHQEIWDNLKRIFQRDPTPEEFNNEVRKNPTIVPPGAARGAENSWPQKASANWGVDGGRVQEVINQQGAEQQAARRIARNRGVLPTRVIGIDKLGQLIYDDSGGVSHQEIWENLKRMFGRDPSPEEMEAAVARQTQPGEQTGRVAPFVQPPPDPRKEILKANDLVSQTLAGSERLTRIIDLVNARAREIGLNPDDFFSPSELYDELKRRGINIDVNVEPYGSLPEDASQSPYGPEYAGNEEFPNGSLDDPIVSLPNDQPPNVSQMPYQGPPVQQPEGMQPGLPGMGPMPMSRPNMEVPEEGGLDVGGLRQQSLFPPNAPNPHIMHPAMADRVDAGFGGPRVFDYTQSPNQQGQMELPWARGENPQPVDADAPAREAQASAREAALAQQPTPEQLVLNFLGKDADTPEYREAAQRIGLADKVRTIAREFLEDERGTLDLNELRARLNALRGTLDRAMRGESTPETELHPTDRPNAEEDAIRQRVNDEHEIRSNISPSRARTIAEFWREEVRVHNQGTSTITQQSHANNMFELARSRAEHLNRVTSPTSIDRGNIEIFHVDTGRVVARVATTQEADNYIDLNPDGQYLDYEDMTPRRQSAESQAASISDEIGQPFEVFNTVTGERAGTFINESQAEAWISGGGSDRSHYDSRPLNREETEQFRRSMLEPDEDEGNAAQLAREGDAWEVEPEDNLFAGQVEPETGQPVNGRYPDTSGVSTNPEVQELDARIAALDADIARFTASGQIGVVDHVRNQRDTLLNQRDDVIERILGGRTQQRRQPQTDLSHYDQLYNQWEQVAQERSNLDDWRGSQDARQQAELVRLHRDAAQFGDPIPSEPLPEAPMGPRLPTKEELRTATGVPNPPFTFGPQDSSTFRQITTAQYARLRGGKIGQVVAEETKRANRRQKVKERRLAKEAGIAVRNKTEQSWFTGFGQDYLRATPDGPPGLSIEDGSSTYHKRYIIVYRGPDGKPVAMAKVDEDPQTGVRTVPILSGDATKGVLGARAAKEVGRAIVHLNAAEADGMISEHTANLIAGVGRLLKDDTGSWEIGRVVKELLRFKNEMLAGKPLRSVKIKTADDVVKLIDQMNGGKTGLPFFASKIKDTAKFVFKDRSGAPPPQGPTVPPQGPPAPPPTPAQKKAEEVHWVREALQVPKNATTMLDLSAPGRQALPLIFTRDFPKALASMFGALHYDTYKKINDDLLSKDIMRRKIDLNTGKEIPSFGEQIGIKFFTPASEPGPRAEATASRWLEMGIGDNIGAKAWQHTAGYPIRASNRAFITLLNVLNVNRTERLLNLARDMSIRGIDTGRTAMPGMLGGMHLQGGQNIGFSRKVSTAEAMDMNPYHNLVLAKEIAEFTNAATGHATAKKGVGGHGWTLENAVSKIGPVLFSPGLLNSRIRMMNPATYIMASPFVRKQYAKAAISTAAAWFVATQMIKNAAGPEAEVNDDITSADFGKVRVGDARLDLGGGFLQFAVAYGRMYEGGSTSSSTGQFHRFGSGYQAQTQEDMMERFMVNKLDPVAKFAWDVYSASEYNPFHVGDRTVQMFVPLFIQDVHELAKEHPELLPIFGPAAFFGGGTQIYSKGESVSKFIDPENDWNVTGGGLRDLMPWNLNNEEGEESVNFPWSQSQ